MLQLELDELFTHELLKAFRERWNISPGLADRIALRTVRIFELQTDAPDKSVSRRRKDAWLKLLINALIGPEPDFLAWIEALATGNYEIRPGNFYSRVSEKGQPALFLLRQRQHIEKLVAKEKLGPLEREQRQRAYLDALRQILVAVLLRELKAACNGKAAVGPAWPMVRATEHLGVEELGLLRYFGGESGFDLHIAKTIKGALTAWIDQRHDGVTPTLSKNYYEKGLPPGVLKAEALKHVDRDTVAIDGYRSGLSQSLELDPALPARATTGANLDEIVEEDVAFIRSALVPETAGPYRFFTEANGGDERFEYDEGCRVNLKAYMPILTSSGSDVQRIEAARRAKQRAVLRQTRPGKMLDQDLQEEIVTFVAKVLPPPRGLTPENARYFEEEVCLFYEAGIFPDQRWRLLGFEHPFVLPF